MDKELMAIIVFLVLLVGVILDAGPDMAKVQDNTAKILQTK